MQTEGRESLEKSKNVLLKKFQSLRKIIKKVY